MDILSLGEPLLEFNQLTEAGRQLYLPGFGGDTSNVAVAAARQGARVGYCTRIGNDTFGDMFMDLWAAEGIDTSQVARDGSAPTGIYFVTHSEAGHAFSYFRAGSAASLMQPEELSKQAIAGVKVLHLSGISQAISDSACDTAFEAIQVAREHGVKVSYDTNLRLKLWPRARAKAIIMATVAHCDICMPSWDDANALTGLSDHDAIIDAFLERGAGSVALKLGADGVVVADASARHRIAGHEVASVDATGAGDTFDGALLAELVAGVALPEAAVYANAAAALSTQGHGAVGPIPRRAAVEAFLAGQA